MFLRICIWLIAAQQLQSLVKPSWRYEVIQPHPELEMYKITLLVLAGLLLSPATASAERIKRKPPTENEEARIASEQAMNDGGLRPGDIVATDRGFLQFRGFAADGSSQFQPVPNPTASSKKPEPRTSR